MSESVVHHSLQRVPTIMGVPALVFELEMAIVGIVVITHAWPMAAILVLTHPLGKWIHRRDERMFEVQKLYTREVDHWDPWHHPDAVDKRPKGYGKGLPC